MNRRGNEKSAVLQGMRQNGGSRISNICEPNTNVGMQNSYVIGFSRGMRCE